MLSEEKLAENEFIVGCYGYLSRQYHLEEEKKVETSQAGHEESKSATNSNTA